MKKILALAAVLLLAASAAFAQLGTGTVNTNLNITVIPEAALTIQTPNTSLTSPGTLFSNYTGTTNFTYFVRTAVSGGVSHITLAVTTDFAGSGIVGPSVGSPLDAADLLTYVPTVPNPSKHGTSTVPSSAVSAALTSTAVTAFSTDARTDRGGVSSSVAWTLVNDPDYQTGSYTAVVTFTISLT
ncbi:MAG: hypothetical protein ABSA59_14150 [Terriglobia bacterium]|jgi:hypothetical protein